MIIIAGGEVVGRLNTTDCLISFDYVGTCWRSRLYVGSTIGNNFFAIEAINGQQILSVSSTSSFELSDIRQVRIGGAVGPGGDPVDPIPEPMSMGLLGSGLAAIGLARKYRKT